MLKIKDILEILYETFDFSIEDISNNGLQVSGSNEITTIAFAVDSDLDVIKKASENHVDLLIVHHGLFWNHYEPIANSLKEKLKLLLNSNINLFAVHLPLDFHKELSHNVSIAKIISDRFTKIEFNKGIISLKTKKDLNEIKQIISEKINLPRAYFFDNFSSRIFISSGRNPLPKNIESGDLFITGEMNYENIIKAKENKINLIIAGHYATERSGMINLMQFLRSKLNRKDQKDLKFLMIENNWNKKIV